MKCNCAFRKATVQVAKSSCVVIPRMAFMAKAWPFRPNGYGHSSSSHQQSLFPLAPTLTSSANGHVLIAQWKSSFVNTSQWNSSFSSKIIGPQRPNFCPLKLIFTIGKRKIGKLTNLSRCLHLTNGRTGSASKSPRMSWFISLSSETPGLSYQVINRLVHCSGLSFCSRGIYLKCYAVQLWTNLYILAFIFPYTYYYIFWRRRAKGKWTKEGEIRFPSFPFQKGLCQGEKKTHSDKCLVEM